jgi:tetratricopeptide (TPR) repeat protein
MKRFAALVGLVLAVALSPARAQQSSDDQYIAIYSLIQQADALQSGGQPRQALDGYSQALAELQKFQKVFPDWDPKIVTFRLDYLAQKINGLAAQFPLPPKNVTPPEPTTPAPTIAIPPATDVEMQLSSLRAQVQGLQSDNAMLQAKLKEAWSAQPATGDTQELAKAQAQVLSLMKENDLLRASATAGTTNGAAPLELSKARQALADANQKLAALEKKLQQRQAPAASAAAETSDEVKTLRARLAVDEAKAVPFTPEELALLKSPAPATTANDAGRKKSANKLPEGSAPLVAEAQNYFSAGDYDKAEADYRQILQSDPNNALVLANLATIEMQENKLADAETHITAALAQNPDDAYNLSTLGFLKFRQQKFDKALDTLSRAAKLDPENPQILNYLGVTLSHKGLRVQAETALRKAIELAPNYGPAHNNLAVIYLGEKPPAPGLARWHYQKALDLGQPRNPELEKLLAGLGAPVNPQ